jgi:hypothetical protein
MQTSKQAAAVSEDIWSLCSTLGRIISGCVRQFPALKLQFDVDSKTGIGSEIIEKLQLDRLSDKSSGRFFDWFTNEIRVATVEGRSSRNNSLDF